MNTRRSSALFLVSGALAGFLSGLMMPMIFGIRGAILGALLAAGAVDVNARRLRRGDKGISVRETCAIAVVVAVVAWGLIVAWDVVGRHGRRAQTESWELFGWTSYGAPLPICLSYAVLILLGYRAHQSESSPSWPWFVAAPFLGAAIRMAFWEELLPAFLFSFALGALPFVLLWLTAARLTDPAWIKRPRRRCAAASKTPPAEGKPGAMWPGREPWTG